MTGRINTYVSLNGVTKVAYTEPGSSSYTPGLYTASQIKRYTGVDVPEKYLENGNVSGYKFAVWEVRLTGEATQPWSMKLHELPAVYREDGTMPVYKKNDSGNPTEEQYYGEVVGYLNHTSTTYDLPIDMGISFISAEEVTYPLQTEQNVINRSERTSWGSRFWIVTAYEADYVQDGYQLKNDIQVEIIPLDGVDTNAMDSSSAQWGYESYDWTYRGDDIGIEKVSNPGKSLRSERQEKEYRSWLEAYKYASGKDQDYGNIKFYSEGEFRGYGFTHVALTEEQKKQLQGGETEVIGAYRDGTSYEMIMADDIMYAYVDGQKGTNASDGLELDYRDYYYTDVKITQRDIGYDIYEDCQTEPQYPNGIDGIGRVVEIWAMFGGEGEEPNKWVKVGEKGSADGDWDESGTLTYTFNEETIARNPWRVKVIHRTVEYKTVCNIDVTACIRHDSPVMKKLMENENLQFVQLEDLSTVIGKVYTTESDQGRLITIVQNDGFNYEQYSNAGTKVNAKGETSQEKQSLKAETKVLYEEDGLEESSQLPQRSNAWANLYQLNKEAAAYKFSSVKNDEKNGRALVTYYLTAYDGYAIYDQAAADYLMSVSEGQVPSPGKNAVMFYDLLPEGVYFDPSVKLEAGRITELDRLEDENPNCYKRNPDKWKKAQVSVTVDSDTDVIENWNGTGRTMVIFHITYDGSDPSVYTDGKWMEGWGLKFGAYYEWKDTKTVQEQYNVSAFMPDLAGLDDPDAELLGESDQIYADGENSDIPQKTENGTTADDPDYKVLKPYRLNALSSGKSNVIYAKCNTVEDIATASSSNIEKTVRADANSYAVYDVSAYVGTGAGYTYNVTVNATEALKDIVVYDHLENAAVDRSGFSNDPNYSYFSEVNNWHGTFLSVETGALKERGIDAVVYYSKNINAPTTPTIDANGNVQESTGNETPTEVLTKDNGWYTKDEIKQEYINEGEKKAALDAMKEQWKAELEKQQGTVLKLPGTAIDAQIELMAEEYIMKAWGVKSVAVDMRKLVGDGNKDFILGAGDSVSFQIRMEAPTTADDDSRLTQEQKQKLIEGDEIYALNNPSFYSCSANTGEDAQSQTRLGDSVRVTLSDKGIYEVVKEFDEENGAKVPEALKDTSFRFRIYKNSTGKAIANKEYTLWEKTVPGDGTTEGAAEGEVQPEWTKISTTSIATDANGYFTLKAGQKAVFRDMTDMSNVKVEELTRELCWKEPEYVESPPAVDADGLKQVTATVKNRYRQVIYVRKEMTGTPEVLPEGVCKDFVFKISLTDENGEPISSNNMEWWRVKNEGLSSGTPERWTDDNGNTSHGTIGEDGLFTVPEGAVIALFSETANVRYTIQEMRVKLNDDGNVAIDDGKVVYEPVPAKGSVTTANDNGENLRQDWICNSPSLSGQFSDTGAVRFITNTYRWKDLYLTKTLKNQEPKDCTEPFTFRISKADGSDMNLKDVEWIPNSELSTLDVTVYESTVNTWELWKLDSSGNPERKSQPGDDAPEGGNGGGSLSGGGSMIGGGGSLSGGGSMIGGGGSMIGGGGMLGGNEGGSLDMLSLEEGDEAESLDENTEQIPLEGKLIKKVITETASDETETTKEVIEVTAYCAGKAIRISGLESGAKYLVEEVIKEGSFYLPENDLQEVTMPVYSAGQSVRFINDYRKRSLTVSKQVVSDSGEAADVPFEMVIVKKTTGTVEGRTTTYTYAPVENQSYQLSGTGISGTGNEGTTDENGKFSLKDGQTATFKDLGVPGEEFVVWEIQNSTYPQIYPVRTGNGEGEKTAEEEALESYKGTLENMLTSVMVGSTSAEGNQVADQSIRLGTESKAILSETGAEVRFINGAQDHLVISKEYTGEIKNTVLWQGQQGQTTPFEDRVKDSIKSEEISKRMGYLDWESLYNGMRFSPDGWNDLNESDYKDESVKSLVQQINKLEKEIFRLAQDYQEDGEERLFAEYTKVLDNLLKYLRWEPNQYDVKLRLTVGDTAESWTPSSSDTITCIDQYFDTTYTIRFGEDGNSKVFINADSGENIEISCETPYPFQIDADGYYTIKPGMLYVLPIDGDMSYTLTESPESAYQVEVAEDTYEDENGIAESHRLNGIITQRLPKEITGTVKTDPMATVINEYRQLGKPISKDMTLKSKPVGQGKPLVWRVEEYTASGWKPASGLEYVILEGESLQNYNMPEKVETTGSDGRITLSRRADGNRYLAVWFIKDDVYVNVEEMTEEMIAAGVKYRVVEVLEESHEDWGVLVGYKQVLELLASLPESLQKPGGEGQLILTAETVPDEEDDFRVLQAFGKKRDEGILLAMRVEHNINALDSYSMDIPYQYRAGFVNSNLISPVEIEKAKLSGKYTGSTFTMTLYQVISSRDEDGTVQTKYEPQAKIKYDVYDSASGKLMEENKSTGPNGEIKLKDGQFARLNLPAELRWAVSEDVQASPDFKLIGLSPKSEEIDNVFIADERLVPGDNLMLIDFGAPTRSIVLTDTILSDGIEVMGEDGTWKFIQKKTSGQSMLASAQIVDRDNNEQNIVNISDTIRWNGLKYKVAGIGAGTFQNCSDLTSVTIPDSVTSIGAGAFQYCRGLTSIVIPAGVTSIEDVTFNGCRRLTSITLPESVTSIGERAFTACSSLTNITIPDSVISIGANAFQSCSGLTSIMIPNSVTNIGSGAFASCSKLTSVAIPEGVTSIEADTFNNCSSLTSVTIPNSVTRIGDQAFAACSGLTHVELPSSVTSIGTSAFKSCTSLVSVEIPEGVTTIGDSTFFNCNKLTSVTIPNSVTSIGSSAFVLCSNLTSIVIPPSVKEIGNDMFMSCKNLKYVYLYSEEGTSFGSSMFKECPSLKAVYFQHLCKENAKVFSDMGGRGGSVFELYTTREVSEEINKLTSQDNSWGELGDLKEEGKMRCNAVDAWPEYPNLPDSWNNLISETSQPDDNAAQASGISPQARANTAAPSEGLRLLSDEAVPQAESPSQGSMPDDKTSQGRSASSTDGVLPDNDLPFGENTQSGKKKRQTVIKTANEVRERGNGSSL